MPVLYTPATKGEVTNKKIRNKIGQIYGKIALIISFFNRSYLLYQTFNVMLILLLDFIKLDADDFLSITT